MLLIYNGQEVEMSHWYDFPPMKRKLKEVSDVVSTFRFEHKGEALTVFDTTGRVAVLTSLEQGMTFCRVVKSVLESDLSLRL